MGEKIALYPEGVARVAVPISPAVKAGNTIYVSGQVALDRDRKVVGENDVRVQTRYVMERIAKILAAGDMTMGNVVSTVVYIVNRSDFKAMNEVYAEFFSGVFPARATVAAGLMTDGLLVEISAVAVKDC